VSSYIRDCVLPQVMDGIDKGQKYVLAASDDMDVHLAGGWLQYLSPMCVVFRLITDELQYEGTCAICKGGPRWCIGLDITLDWGV
jgi:hypothetical protein